MRTIKFRGYSDELKSFVYGFYQEVNVNGVVYSYIFWQGNTTPVITDSVGQFTGLHDKNGKEIYTGDILQLKKLDGIVLLYKIFFVKGGFAFNTHQDDFYKPQIEIYFYESTSDMQNSSFISTLEIIGNIFENPELLEKKFAD